MSHWMLTGRTRLDQGGWLSNKIVLQVQELQVTPYGVHYRWRDATLSDATALLPKHEVQRLNAER